MKMPSRKRLTSNGRHQEHSNRVQDHSRGKRINIVKLIHHYYELLFNDGNYSQQATKLSLNRI